MKTRNRLVLVITLLTSSVLLTSCALSYKSGKAGAHKKHEIALSVNSHATELLIDTGQIGNCSHRKNGCIVVPYKETAVIAFKLKASSKWHLTEIKICQGSDKPDNPDSCSLEEWQRSQFGVFLKTGGQKYFPDSKGVINLESSLGNTVRKFVLFDYNGTKQDYFYTIKACPGTNKEGCITTDPSIENKGRN